jgi:hypothetical protein
MRRRKLHQYLVFRVKVIELFDINALGQALTNRQISVPTNVGRQPSDLADSLRTVQLSWFSILIDQSRDGMNVFKLWSELFPLLKGKIEEVWENIQPTWETLRGFRDKAGFHADKPMAFFDARSRIVQHDENIAKALGAFQNLLLTVLKAEKTALPDLAEAVDDFLDELEADHNRKYDRAEFKRYLMLPERSCPATGAKAVCQPRSAEAF